MVAYRSVYVKNTKKKYVLQYPDHVCLLNFPVTEF